MTQFDAGPGDWREREWDDLDRKQRPQARRRLILPPWALVAVIVAVAVVACVGLVLVIRAIRGGEARPTPTALPTSTTPLQATATFPLAGPTAVPPTATIVLPVGLTEEPTPQVFTEIAPGASVVVQGTLGVGLNLRAQPGRTARLVGGAKEGTVLLVLEGPQQADNLTWWKLRAPDGKEGWAAADYLVLKP